MIQSRRHLVIKIALVFGLGLEVHSALATGLSCRLQLAGPPLEQSAEKTREVLTRLGKELPEEWEIPASGTLELKKFLEKLTPALRAEIEDVGSWTKTRTEKARVAVPVARLPRSFLAEVSRPRQHIPLPSLKKDGGLFFPPHVELSLRSDRASENFHIRMMAIKDKGQDSFQLPPQVEYLRRFIEMSFELEKKRDPQHFNNRYAYIQVDSSWVEAGQLQPRPGRLTEQVAQPQDRKGAHVDGFLTERFYDLQEDVTYSMSTGWDPKTQEMGDAVPTEFYDRPFPLSSGLNHAEARVLFDRMANQMTPLFLPYGFINRMTSRCVHRVGVASKRTYRTFVKVKFSDEVFNQAENTVNGIFQEGRGGDLTAFQRSSLYENWKRQGLPLVDRATLPTEGLITEADREVFNHRRRIGRE